MIQRRKREKGTSYHVTYKDPFTGTKRHYKTFHKLRDAMRCANELRTIIDDGGLPETRTALQPMVFSEVVAEVEKELEKNLNLGEFSQNTYTDHCYWLNSVIKVFGDKIVSEIRQTDIVKYRSEMAVVHSNVASNKNLQVFKLVMKKAVQMHALNYDPTLNIRKFSENANKRNRFLKPNELNILVSGAKQGRAIHYLPALILLGAEHGASKQECLYLQWSDINFDHDGIGLIKFNRNERQRTQYLMPRTKTSLIKWRDHLTRKRGFEHTRTAKSDHVFCRINGQPIKDFNKSFRQACKAAEIKDSRFHDLRQTFRTNLLLSGAGIDDVKEMIDHSDIWAEDFHSDSMLKRKHFIQERLAKHYDFQ